MSMSPTAYSFISNISRIWADGYIPNDLDILCARLKTTNITDCCFALGPLTYRVFDVGGQRSERKKWIHCFENVQCVLFMVAISGYDQCLVEDMDTVRRTKSRPASRINCGSESNERGVDTVRVHCELPVVYQVSDDPLSQQDGSVQGEASAATNNGTWI